MYAHWQGLLQRPQLMGTLSAVPVRGKEVFSFAYDAQWLAQVLDPALQLFAGPQYLPEDQFNFGVSLDSSLDCWGRLLMRWREDAQQVVRFQERRERPLLESDYLLGVFDERRMGGLRFKTDLAGPFLYDNRAMTAPPCTSLRELEHVSLQLERMDGLPDLSYLKWLLMLLTPRFSLGGVAAMTVRPNWARKLPLTKLQRY